MSPETSLPGVFDLIRSGIALYERRWKPVVAIVLLQFVVSMLLGGAVVVSFFMMSATTIALGVALFIVFFVLLFWFQLTLLHAFADETLPGVRAAFGRAWPQIGAYLWVSVLVGLVMLAVIAAAVALGVGGYFLLSKGVAFVILMVVLGFAVIGSLTYFATRFVFVNWIVVEDKARGVAVLKESLRLSQGRFWPLFGRFVGFGLVAIVVIVAVDIVGRALGGGGQILSSLVNTLVVSPAIVAVTLVLYRAVVAQGGEA